MMPGTLLLPKSEIQPAPLLMAAISAALLAVVFLSRTASRADDDGFVTLGKTPDIGAASRL
jgi:hypothetical protein